MKKVSIIILQCNGIDILDNCLKTVLKTDYPNYEIIMVDNNSKDNSVEFVKKNYPKVKIIENKKNKGYAEGNNCALEHVTGDYVVFLNNDTEVDPNWLRYLVKTASKNKDTAICQPKVLSLNNKKKFDYAGAAGGYIDLYGYPICRGRIFNDVEEDINQYDDSCEIFWSCGVCLFIKKCVLDEIGSFDSNFFAYYEETDLCWRAHLRGYKIMYVPEAKIYHLGSGTSRRNIFKKYLWIHRNHTLVLIKNYNLKNVIKRIPIKIFLDISQIPYFLFTDIQRACALIYVIFWSLFHPSFFFKNRRDTQRLRKVSDKNIEKKMINKSVVFLYFFKNKKRFSDYKKYIPILN